MICRNVSYYDAVNAAHNGAVVRHPGWNDETFMALDGKRVRMNLGGKFTNCAPRTAEMLSDDWIVEYPPEEPLPAPPHERSEGEPTERPGAVDPYTKGLHAGREEMRERAAQLIETTQIAYSNTAEKPYLSPRRPGDTNALPYADAIRSLPLQAEGEDTPHG